MGPLPHIKNTNNCNSINDTEVKHICERTQYNQLKRPSQVHKLAFTHFNKSVLPMVKLKPSMLKVALRHFLNPGFLDVACAIVAFGVHSSALCHLVDECEEQSTFPGEK